MGLREFCFCFNVGRYRTLYANEKNSIEGNIILRAVTLSRREGMSTQVEEWTLWRQLFLYIETLELDYFIQGTWKMYNLLHMARIL